MTRNIRRLAVGQVCYTALCNETGGMIDDGTVFRLGEDNFRFVGGDPYDGVWLKEQAERLGLKAFVKPSTDQLHNLAVQGPLSRDILRGSIWTPPTQTGAGGPAAGSASRRPDRRLRRHPGRRVAHGLHAASSATRSSATRPTAPRCGTRSGRRAQPHGITPLGLEALDVVRIECGLIFAGYEFDDQVDPFEAGIGFTVALDSTDEDFIGRAALEERRAHPQRGSSGWSSRATRSPGTGTTSTPGASASGVVTSGCRSPYVRKPIALCRMSVQYAELGTELEIGKLDGLQKRIPATVVRFPFYDPDKTRPRS